MLKLFFKTRNLKLTEKKSILIRYYLVSFGNYSLKAKSGLVLRITRIILLVIIGLKKRKSNNPIIINCGGKHLEKHRTKYLAKYTPYNEFLFIYRDSNKYYYDKMNIIVLYRIFIVCFLFYVVAFVSLFNNSVKENDARFLNSFSYLLQISLLDKSTNVYCLQIWMPESYIVSRIAAKLGYKTTMITSGSPIHCNNRYVFAPKVDLKFASKFQKEELRILTERQHFVVESITEWGPENVEDFNNLTRGEDEFDVGIYSGGSWARNEKNLRVSNEAELANESRGFNDYYRAFQLILEVSVELKREFPSMRIAVFPHPHERILIKKGIDPPYLNVLKKNNFYFESGNENSVSSFFKTKIGIAVTSTAVFDRIHCGLKSLLYSGENIQNSRIAPHYLGSYGAICFSSKDELKNMICNELKISKNV